MSKCQSVKKVDRHFCVNLPKLELHAHLGGSLSERTLKELHTPDESINHFLKLNILELGPKRTLEECFEIFKIAHQATSTMDNVYKATTNVIKEFSDDNVIYLELRTTPRNERHMTKAQYIDAIIKAIEHCKLWNSIIVKVILSLDRRQTVEEAEETVLLAMKYRKNYPNIVVGIDVSGDPTKGIWFKDLLLKVRNESDLKITIHCAEVPNKAEIEEILDFKPDRIGHGTCICEENGGSEELWEKFEKLRIPIECCLTSNLKTKTVRSYDQYPLKKLFNKCLNFSLCTDDKGVFSTSLSQEFKIAADVFNLKKDDLWTISLRSTEYAFCSEQEKWQLNQTLIQWCNSNMKDE